MSQHFLSSFVTVFGLLATNAISPASAQTPAMIAPNVGVQAAPQAPMAHSPPSTVAGVTGTPTKPDPDTTKSNQNTSPSSDRVAFFEADLAALHAGLMLTFDQEKLWPAVEQSIRAMSTIKADTREAVKNVFEPQDDKGGNNQSRSASDPSLKTDPFLAIKATSVLLLERGKALQSLADASGPLYGSLSFQQKGRLPVLVRSLAPNNVRLRHFIDLLTWDTTAETREDRAARNGRAKQIGDRWGSRDPEQSDGRHDCGAMRHGGYHGWSGRRQADRDQAREEGEPGRMSGRTGSRGGYGMRQSQQYDDMPYDSDD